MAVIQLAQQAAMMKGWPAQPQANGELRVEVVTQAARTQLVTITLGRDGDGDAAAFVWSKAGDTRVIADPVAMLRHNLKLTYGKVALKDNDVVVMHALYDATADVNQVAKAIFWVARAADDLEMGTYGMYSDTL